MSVQDAAKWQYLEPGITLKDVSLHSEWLQQWLLSTLYDFYNSFVVKKKLLLANSFTSKNNSQFNFCFSYRGVISNSNYFSFSKYFLIS